MFFLYINDLLANLRESDVNRYYFAVDLGLNVKVINDFCAANTLCLTLNDDKTMDLNVNLRQNSDNILSMKYLRIIVQSNLKSYNQVVVIYSCCRC